MKLSARNRLLLMMLVLPLLLIGAYTLSVKLLHPVSASASLLLPPDDPDVLPQPASGGTRGPSALLFTPDGKKLYVAEQDENTIAVYDPSSRRAIEHLPSGGEQPTALALSPDGKTIVAANTFSGTVGILDLEKRTIRTQVPLLGEPCGVAITDSGKAFVSVGQLDQVAVINMASGKVTARLSVGHHPRTLLLMPDGLTLLCENRIGGSLSVIDTDSNKETARIAIPATNLRGMALSPDGSRVYLTGQQPHNDIPTDKPEGIWTNVLCTVRLANGTGSIERVLMLDQPNRGAADPCGVVLDESGEYAYITLSGTHEVIRVPARPINPGVSATPMQRIHVGANPRAIALRPGGSELWIGNHLGNSLSVITAAGGNILPPASRSRMETVEMETPTPSPNRRLRGRYFFTSAHIVRGQHFSCDSCHPDGDTDGLSWRLAHVKEPPEVRNTRDLRGNLLLTGPYGWTSREEDFEAFVEDEVSGLLKTRLLQHPEVHALWDLVNESPLPSNPYRNSDGTLTDPAKRGRVLFTGQAGCVSCHVGDMRGGTKRRGWVGTTPTGLKLDVPHLVGAYESAPYLHDGRAATLEEIFTKYNPRHLHGRAHTLTPAQFSDLMEYVREL